MPTVRTTVNVDSTALREASRLLGTQGTSATVNAALQRVVRQLLLADFDIRREVDGTPEEVEEGRSGRPGG